MDRRVKERLIGASILTVLVVLVVPELLSGPAPGGALKSAPNVSEASRNVTIDLATRKSTSQELTADGQPPDGTQPAASAASAASPAAQPASRPQPSVVTMPPALAKPPPGPPPAVSRPPPAAAAARAAKPASPAASVERPAPPPTSRSTAASSAGRGWAVQLGVFASRSNADKLARDLKGKGYPAYVAAGGARFRVRVGPMPDRASAAQAMARLQSMGHKGTLAAPGN